MVGSTVLLILCLIYTRTLSEDVPEFQYPCYVDVCTFPSQFCNSDRYERRCSPCSRSICRSPSVPLACRYICMKNNELTTTPRPTPSTGAPQQIAASQGNDSLASLHLIMAYSAISTTLLVVVLLAFVAYYIHRKRESKDKQITQVRYRHDPNHQINLDQSERLLQEYTCLNCGQRPRPETDHAPPSYATTDQGNHQVLSRNESSGSSTDDVNNFTKTQRVKPMTAQGPTLKLNNDRTDNETSIRQSVTNTASDLTFTESLMDSPETADSDETSRKS